MSTKAGHCNVWVFRYNRARRGGHRGQGRMSGSRGKAEEDTWTRWWHRHGHLKTQQYRRARRERTHEDDVISRRVSGRTAKCGEWNNRDSHLSGVMTLFPCLSEGSSTRKPVLLSGVSINGVHPISLASRTGPGTELVLKYFWMNNGTDKTLPRCSELLREHSPRWQAIKTAQQRGLFIYKALCMESHTWLSPGYMDMDQPWTQEPTSESMKDMWEGGKYSEESPFE